MSRRAASTRIGGLVAAALAVIAASAASDNARDIVAEAQRRTDARSER